MRGRVGYLSVSACGSYNSGFICIFVAAHLLRSWDGSCLHFDIILVQVDILLNLLFARCFRGDRRLLLDKCSLLEGVLASTISVSFFQVEMLVNADLVLCEHVKDLLDRGLLQGVLRDMQSRFVLLELTKDLADRHCRLDTEAVEVREMLDNVELSKCILDEIHDVAA